MKPDHHELILAASERPGLGMRIALVTETFPPEINGVAMTLGRLVEGLIQRGHQVQIVRPRQHRFELAGTTPNRDELLVSGLPIPGYQGLNFGLPSKAILIREWQHFRPDIVHVATEGPLGWSAVAAARDLKLPVSSSFHTNFDHYAQHYGIGFLKSPVEAYLKAFHNRTDATLVPTRTLMTDLSKRGFRNLGLMSRGVATAQFSPTRRSQELRASWGVKSDAPVALYVGRLAKEKNLEAVVAAFALMKQHQPAARMVFVGDGPLRDSLQRACPEAIFAGMRTADDLACHYASADIFLFASLSETYGNVVPEALASGLGVVAYAQAAAAEHIYHGFNGLAVGPGDEAAFLNAALSLVRESHVLAKIRSKAAQSVSHLDWSSVQDQFVRSLREVHSRCAERLQGLSQRLATS